MNLHNLNVSTHLSLGTSVRCLSMATSACRCPNGRPYRSVLSHGCHMAIPAHKMLSANASRPVRCIIGRTMAARPLPHLTPRTNSYNHLIITPFDKPETNRLIKSSRRPTEQINKIVPGPGPNRLMKSCGTAPGAAIVSGTYPTDAEPKPNRLIELYNWEHNWHELIQIFIRQPLRRTDYNNKIIEGPKPPDEQMNRIIQFMLLNCSGGHLWISPPEPP